MQVSTIGVSQPYWGEKHPFFYQQLSIELVILQRKLIAFSSLAFLLNTSDLPSNENMADSS
jgi:hypothetical protein